MSLSKDEVMAMPFYNVKYFISKIDKDVIFDCLILKPIIFTQLKKHKLYIDEDFIIEISKINPLIIKYISNKLKSNLTFMLKLSKIPNTVIYCYENASFDIKQNIEFKLNLIKNNVDLTIELNCRYFYNNWKVIVYGLIKNAEVFDIIDDSFKTNIQIVKELLKINPFVIKYLSDDLKSNLEIISIALYKNGLTLKYLTKFNTNFIVVAICSNPKIIDHLKIMNEYSTIYSNIKKIITTNYNVRLFLNNQLSDNCRHIEKKQKNNCKQNILNKLSVCDYFFGFKFNRMIIDYIIDDVRFLNQHIFNKYKLALSIIDAHS
jgi:hypothetical protein